MNGSITSLQEWEDSLEDTIDSLVSASTSVPATDDSGIVTVDAQVRVRHRLAKKSADEELEADGLEPPDVATISLPSREDPPCSPPPRNDDRHPNARACV